MKRAHILFLILSVVFCSSAIAEDGVRVGIFNFPPFYSKKAGEPAKGFLVDYALQEFKEAGERPVFKIYHTPTLIKNIATGEVDVGMLIKHPALIETAHYSSKPISSIELVAFRGMNSPAIDSYAELAGKDLLVLAGYGYGGLRNKISQLDPVPRMIEASDIQSGLDMLLAGRAEYFLSYLKPSREIAARKGYTGQDNWLVSDEISKFDVYWVISKKMPRGEQLLKRLEAVQ